LRDFRIRFDRGRACARGSKRTALHHCEEHRNEDKNVNRGRNHASNDRRGDRFHHVRTDPGFAKDWNEAREHDRDGHQFGTEAMYGALDNRRLQVGFGQRSAGYKAAIKGVTEVNHHDNAGLDGNAKKRDIAHPDRYAEVVPEPPLQNQSSGESVDRRENQYGCFRNGVKDHIQEDKNQEEHDGHDEFEPLLRAQFELVFAGPLPGVARRKPELPAKKFVCLVDETAVVCAIEVDIDITRQSRVLIADHGRAARKRNPRDFSDWYLSARWRGNQETAQSFDVVAEITAVP